MPATALQYKPTTPEIAGLEGQLKDLQTQTDQRLAPIQAEREKATTALQQEIDRPVPAAPNLEQIPQYQPRVITPQETEQFAGLSMALASLASLATRQPLTAALNTAGLAMQSFHKGALDQAELEMKQFKTQADAAAARNNEALQQYNAVLKNRRLSFSQKQSMLTVIANKERDEIALAQLKSQDLRAFLDLQQKRLDGMNQWNRFAVSFQQKAQQHADDIRVKEEAIKQKKEAMAGQTLTESQLEPVAWQFLLTGKMPALGFGAAQTRMQIIAKAQAIGKSMGLSPQEQATLPFNTKAQQGALDFMTKWGAGVRKGEEVVKLNGQIMLEYAQKLGFTDIQFVNKAILAGKTQFGDPAAQAYANAAITVMNEYARVMAGPMSNAMLHQGAMERAGEAVNKSNSINQLKEALKVMEREMNNQDKSVNDTIQGIHMAMQIPAMKAPPGAPPVGTVQDGYRYKGGDPGLESSWEPVQ